MPHVHWAMASPTARKPIKCKHPEVSDSQVSYGEQSQELHLALHLLNVPLMSNTRKCGCLKSQGIRFPLSSFLMDMQHILWSKSPPLRGLVTGPWAPALWGSAGKFKGSWLSKTGLFNLSRLLIHWMPIEGSVAYLQKPTLQPNKTTKALNLWSSSTPLLKFNKEQEQLRQLPTKYMPSGQSSLLLHHHFDFAMGFIIILNYSSSVLFFAEGPHPLALPFRRLRYREVNWMGWVIQSRNREI